MQGTDSIASTTSLFQESVLYNSATNKALRETKWNFKAMKKVYSQCLHTSFLAH